MASSTHGPDNSPKHDVLLRTSASAPSRTSASITYLVMRLKKSRQNGNPRSLRSENFLFSETAEGRGERIAPESNQKDLYTYSAVLNTSSAVTALQFLAKQGLLLHMVRIQYSLLFCRVEYCLNTAFLFWARVIIQ